MTDTFVWSISHMPWLNACLGQHMESDVNPVIGIQSAADIRLTLSALLKSSASHISITGVIVTATYLL